MKIWPYLHFFGNAEEAMNFYMDIFGAQVVGQIHRHSDAPTEYTQEGTSSNPNGIMNAFIKRGNNEMMFSDVPEGAVVFGTNNYISLTCDTEEEVDRIYQALAADAKKVEMELAFMFRGSKFASLIDKFGVAWYLGRDKPQA